MPECKKIIISRKDEEESDPSGCISIIIEDGKLSETDIDFSLSKSVANNSNFIMIWLMSNSNIEESIDSRIEDRNLIQISTTTHENESAKDVTNFAKYATLIDRRNFYCLIFSNQYSQRTEQLIKEISEI